MPKFIFKKRSSDTVYDGTEIVIRTDEKDLTDLLDIVKKFLMASGYQISPEAELRIIEPGDD